jgi:hypothetical protein
MRKRRKNFLRSLSLATAIGGAFTTAGLYMSDRIGLVEARTALSLAGVITGTTFTMTMAYAFTRMNGTGVWLRQLQAPPKGFGVDLLLPPDRAEDVLFNLLGRYEYWVQQHGAIKARIIFATQSFGCVLNFWTEWLLRRVKLLKLLRKP